VAVVILSLFFCRICTISRNVLKKYVNLNELHLCISVNSRTVSPNILNCNVYVYIVKHNYISDGMLIYYTIVVFDDICVHITV
jgi:hypothetical protein